jgi:hypothetical protein
VSEYDSGTATDTAPVLAFGQLLRTRWISWSAKPVRRTASSDRRFIRRLEKIEKLPKRAKQALLKTIDTYLVGVEKR